MRVPIEAAHHPAVVAGGLVHHPLKMRVPIEACRRGRSLVGFFQHHPLKMRVPIEAVVSLACRSRLPKASPSENEGPY